CLGGYVAAGLAGVGERTTVLLLSAVAFGGFIVLVLRRARFESDDRRGLMWPIEWLAELRSLEGRVRVAAARYHSDVGVSEEDVWRRQRGADRARRAVG